MVLNTWPIWFVLWREKIRQSQFYHITITNSLRVAGTEKGPESSTGPTGGVGEHDDLPAQDDPNGGSRSLGD